METSNENEKGNKKTNYRVYFFWVAYVALLSASTPHMAYFFAAHSDLSWFDWTISFIVSFVIEASIYIASWTIYQYLRQSPDFWKIVFKNGFLFLWIVTCTIFSWYCNSIYSAHFEHKEMLSGAGGIPFFDFAVYAAGSFPIAGLIFSIVSRTATKKFEDEVPVKVDVRTPEQIIVEANRQQAILIAQAGLNKTKARLAGETLRAQLSGSVSAVGGGLISGAKAALKDATTGNNVEYSPIVDITSVIEERKRTGNLELLSAPQKEEDEDIQEEPKLTQEEKLATALQIVREDYDVTDEKMAIALGIDKPSAARFWTLKAKSIIEDEKSPAERDNDAEKNNSESRWPGVKEVDGKSVGFSSIKPFYLEDGLTFVNISSAYQNKGKNPETYGASMRHKLITTKSLRAVIDAKLIPSQYVRFIRINAWGKDSLSIAVLINVKCRNAIIEAIKKL